MKSIKRLISFLLLAVLILGFPNQAAAEKLHSDTLNIQLNNNIGFILYKDSVEHSVTRAKSYTSDSYSGYFYYVDTGNKISEHKFSAKFSYDGTLATCYETSSSTKMLDQDSNLRPKATGEGRNNLTPTQVYGYVTFVLYNADNSVNNEVSVKIYCNQDGSTWVNRQG